MKKKILALILSLILVIPNFKNASNVTGNSFELTKIRELKSKKEKNVDLYNYYFDTKNEFSGLNDKYEVKNVCDDNNVKKGYIDESGNKIEIENPSNNEKKLIEPIFTDPNENNDSFATASVVYKAGQDDGHYGNYVYWGATISQKSSGWWLWETKYIDKDFYSFDVTVTGKLEVKLKYIPQNCDYDLRVYKLEDNINANCNDLDFATSSYYISSNAGNEDEYICINNATPGTYYAVVYSYQDKTWNNDEAYQIWFQQTQNTSSADVNYNINNGRNNNDVGALWVSDYKPLGVTPTTLSDSNSKVYFNNINTYPFIRNLSSRYRSEDLMYARLYVWDVPTRAAIYEILNRILNTIVSYNEWEDNKQRKFNLITSTTSLGLAVEGMAISWISLAELAAAVASALSIAGFVVSTVSLAVALASFIAVLGMKSPFDITKANLREYLINAKAGFEIGKGSNNQQVVMLRFRYHFGESNGNYFDYSPLYRNSDYNLYSNTSIDYIDTNSCINGHVKGFKTIEEVKEILK